MRAFGFKSVHAGAIFGRPEYHSEFVGVLSVSPPLNVILPFEFRKNAFQTLPFGPGTPNRNSNPPSSGLARAGLLAPSGDASPSLSSPRKGAFWSSPPAT